MLKVLKEKEVIKKNAEITDTIHLQKFEIPIITNRNDVKIQGAFL